MDRIVAVESAQTPFDRDESFDLPGFWAEHTTQFVASLLAEHVTIRLSPRGMQTLRFAVEPPAFEQAHKAAGRPDGQGRVTTLLPVESLDVAYDMLLRLGPEVEVLDPPQLRTRMAEAADRLARMYRGQR